jgi:hypothetical protein
MTFSEPLLLLPGEDLRDFEAIRRMMIDDIQPEANVEWLWTLDLIELSWEILRYRGLKKRILDAHRAAAIEYIPTSSQLKDKQPVSPLLTLHALPHPSNSVFSPRRGSRARRVNGGQQTSAAISMRYLM